jgi:hypothetical protein
MDPLKSLSTTLLLSAQPGASDDASPAPDAARQNNARTGHVGSMPQSSTRRTTSLAPRNTVSIRTKHGEAPGHPDPAPQTKDAATTTRLVDLVKEKRFNEIKTQLDHLDRTDLVLAELRQHSKQLEQGDILALMSMDSSTADSYRGRVLGAALSGRSAEEVENVAREIDKISAPDIGLVPGLVGKRLRTYVVMNALSWLGDAPYSTYEPLLRRLKDSDAYIFVMISRESPELHPNARVKFPMQFHEAFPTMPQRVRDEICRLALPADLSATKHKNCWEMFQALPHLSRPEQQLVLDQVIRVTDHWNGVLAASRLLGRAGHRDTLRRMRARWNARDFSPQEPENDHVLRELPDEVREEWSNLFEVACQNTLRLTTLPLDPPQPRANETLSP